MDKTKPPLIQEIQQLAAGKLKVKTLNGLLP